MNLTDLCLDQYMCDDHMHSWWTAEHISSVPFIIYSSQNKMCTKCQRA